MKKILLIALAYISFTQVQAQCTPDPSETAPGIHPTTTENIAPATVGTPYAQTLTVIIPADTTIEVFGIPQTIPIDKAVVTSVTGLPTGFTYACNPSNCEFPGGQTNCAIITGTAVAGQEGSYPLTINVTYYVAGLEQDDEVTGYVLSINPVGLWDLNKPSAITMTAGPNPFNQNATIDFVTPKAMDVKITLYNLLGAPVRTEMVKATAGNNSYLLKGANIQNGIYLVEISDGKRKITQRLVKQ